LADPPESAHVDGVVNVQSGGGVCYFASLAELIIQRDPCVTYADCVARSGFGTTAGWGIVSKATGHALSPIPRALTQGAQVDLSRLYGVGYRVGYGKGEVWKPGLLTAAEGRTLFSSADEAVLALKTLIAASTPVQVHLDMYYVWDEVAAVYPLWTPGVKSHGSHFGVVVGYDADHVYITDNGPEGPSGEPGEDMPVLWDNFLMAWRETPNLVPNGRGLFGPCFMCWLTSDPVNVDDDFLIAWLGIDATRSPYKWLTVGPDAIRLAAADVRSGRNVRDVVGGFSGGTMGSSRALMAEYLDDIGQYDLAALYEHSADLCADILETIMTNPDDPGIADKIDEIADTEEEALTMMASFAGTVDAVVPLAPADDGNLESFEDVVFHWAMLPTVKAATLQLAMTGDFADRRNTAAFSPKNGNWFFSMTKSDWLKVLRKEGGDRSLKWRIVSPGKDAVVSDERTLTWDAQAISALTPASDYSFGEGELVTFTWTAPALALGPRVVLSTDGDFSNRKTRVCLVPRRGQSQVSFKERTLVLLRKKDDDGVVYWRVEDAGARITTVEPSPVRTLNLP